MLLNALFLYFSFLYGCNVPELSYLIEIGFRCPHQMPYFLYIVLYIYFFINIPIGHISVIILMGVIKRV